MINFFSRITGLNKYHKEIETRLQYRFNNIELMKTAFIHRSVDSSPNKNFERFELIGDSVLSLIVIHWLANKYPNSDEGILTKKRAALVNRSFLSEIGSLLNLQEFLIVAKGVNTNDSKVSRNITADLYESVVGAIFTDSNFINARDFVFRTLIPNENLSINNINFKGRLIEYSHKKFSKPPIFTITSSNGPDHNKSFQVEVAIGNEFVFEGDGNSIKDAEQTAAKNALQELNI